MWKKFVVYTFIAILAASAALISPVELSATALQDGINSARADGVPTELFGADGMITTITNILLFIVGALAVIMIIVGGMRYVISGGNSANVTAAKNTVMYAIVGLIVAFLAFAAINFILGAIAPGGNSNWTTS